MPVPTAAHVPGGWPRGSSVVTQSWGTPQLQLASGREEPKTRIRGWIQFDVARELFERAGAEFDALWLQSMINHHRGAIEMAESVLLEGENDDVRALAEAVIATQTAEIEEMEAYSAD